MMVLKVKGVFSDFIVDIEMDLEDLIFVKLNFYVVVVFVDIC